jgi:hypothetical protein
MPPSRWLSAVSARSSNNAVVSARRIAVAAVLGATLVAVPAVQALGRNAAGSLGCDALGSTIARPAGIPVGFPIPRGMRFSDAYTNAAGTTVVLGFAPLSLHTAASWYRRAAAAAGYRATWVDAERGEAEARVVQARTTVLWRVNAVPGCARTVVVTLDLSGRPGRGIAAG